MNIYIMRREFELKYIYPQTKGEYDRIGLQIKDGEPVFLFPCKYPDPWDDDARKQDMLNILRIVDRYKSQKKVHDSFEEERKFPFDAYIWIIKDYIENWYYVENETEYTKIWNWKIDWKRTIKNNKIYVWLKNIIYSELIKKRVTYDSENIITSIHHFCVNEAIDKMWWYFWLTNQLGENIPLMERSSMIQILQSEYIKTFIDSKKRLLLNMIRMLEWLDNNFKNSTRFDISTKDFEDVFEQLLRKQFWTVDESNFNPTAQYYLLQPDWSYNKRPAWDLIPDVILKDNNDIYVIDAKYYSYWFDNEIWSLPATSSIHKQITYAEDVENIWKYDMIYNLFILPYNWEDFLKYVWYANTSWKSNKKSYENVHVVLVNMRSLINWFNKSKWIKLLTDIIKEKQFLLTHN